MRALAAYIMRGRWQAALAAMAGALLSVLAMPFSAPLVWGSGGAIGLVALRHGPREGLWVALLASAGLGAVGWPLLGGPQLAIAMALAVWLPVWLAATVLYKTVSLPSALQMCALAVVVFVVTVHVVLPEPAAWWREVLEALREQLGAEAAPLFAHADQAARLMTGMLAAVLLMNIVGALLVARWWQARLYNPGGFGDEFRGLRFGRWFAASVLVLATVALLAPSRIGALALDLLWVVAFMYLLLGFAVLHAVTRARRLHVGWLIGLYAAVVLTFPMGAVGLALLGLGDTWLNFRALVGDKA